MALNLDSTNIQKLYLGTTQINKAYLGNTLVFTTVTDILVDRDYDLQIEAQREFEFTQAVYPNIIYWGTNDAPTFTLETNKFKGFSYWAGARGAGNDGTSRRIFIDETTNLFISSFYL